MRKKTAEEVLEYMIETLAEYLEELFDFPKGDCNEFIDGEKLAYVECLEMIQCWEKAQEKALNFDIEEKYPLN